MKEEMKKADRRGDRMKCDNCSEKVDVCDSCDSKFSKGDIIFCSLRDMGKHFCSDCGDIEGNVE